MDITKNCKYIARGRALIRACGSRGECVGAGIHHALAPIPAPEEAGHISCSGGTKAAGAGNEILDVHVVLTACTSSFSWMYM